MKVMVTGATTPLGAAIIDQLRGRADVELVLAVGGEHVPASPDPAHDLLYRRVDLTRPRTLHDFLWGEARELGITAIVHGMHHRCRHDTGARIHAQNVSSTRELVRECTGHPTIRRFVYRSFGELYAPRGQTTDVVDEDAPLDFDPAAPQWLRDRLEADLAVCAHLSGEPSIAVLRCAEILAPGVGSPLWDYLSSRVCVHPFGFDPMINVLSLEDAAAAFAAAAASTVAGVFNIPGKETLPLSRAIAESLKMNIGLPARLEAHRFQFGAVLDGTRARTAFGYTPATPVSWPRPWWRRLIDQLGRDRVQPMRPPT